MMEDRQMKIYAYPERNEWDEILKRPLMDTRRLFGAVQDIIDSVRSGGDKAVLELEKRFDHVELSALCVSTEEMDAAERAVPDELKDAIVMAKENIARFHSAQRFRGIEVETRPGVRCCQRSVPIERVGLYVPGGTAPLFSTVLMLAVPARIAGCREIVLCTPPAADGRVNPAVLFAARTAGVGRIFKIGGVQAIAAMTYGTESVPRVDKIFGPGNQYVMAAKQLVSLKDVAIDMPAGPSEVEVIADETADAAFVAADLISQAEHGTDSQAVLVTTSQKLLHEVEKEVGRQLAVLPRRDIAAQSLANSKLILTDSMDTAMELTNAYAPEHLIIQAKDYRRLADRVVNAGSVFLGAYACESAGDYASGTNHTLPTNGYARAYSGVNLDSFCRKITFQELTAQGLRNIGPAIELMAEGEHLHGHRNAVTVRLDSMAAGAGEEGGGFCPDSIVRPNIRRMAPYSSARSEYSGREASVFLDANENPYNSPLNRYPDPLQTELREEISRIKGVPAACIFCGNGSDEAIDLAFRIFCEPGRDNVVAMDPTYGMYGVCAEMNDVEYRTVPLGAAFSLDAGRMLDAADGNTRLMFVCTPNNPTGNDLNHAEIERLLQGFGGMVVVDEAYGDFSDSPSFLRLLGKYPNLIVLQTLSKAWGCAAIRLGMAFAAPEVIALYDKVKYPYNVNLLTQQNALEQLRNAARKDGWVEQLKDERRRVTAAFRQLPCVETVYPTDANFFLTRVTDADAIYAYLVDNGIIVRNRNRVTLCGNCLRVTVGTPQENDALTDALKRWRQ